MRKVAEHREDKYSSSLHLISANDGTRFCDEHTPQAKGIIMQSDPKYTAERVARVRQLRRAAIRRRRMLVVSLLAITVVVLAIAFPLKFSPLFALIPFTLTLVVVALGARAAAQARAWERKVAASRAQTRKAKKTPAQTVVESAAQAARQIHDVKPASGAASVDGAVQTRVDEPDTHVMEQREIRRALEQARREQAQAFAEREARRRNEERAAAQVATEPVRESSDPSQATIADELPVDSVAESAQVVSTSESVQSDEQVPDETSELAHVSPSRALDAFDMASGQDLISFSLGTPRNGVDVSVPAPESLEIKSAKQVAKAVPVEQNAAESVAEPAVEPTEDATPADDATKSDQTAETVNDTAAFHASEEQGAVDAPEATSDSLGNGLEAILARRSV
ncbi:hypothetical protein [Bifidobacterium simiiventris]